jgi:hypothetical protein
MLPRRTSATRTSRKRSVRTFEDAHRAHEQAQRTRAAAAKDRDVARRERQI